MADQNQEPMSNGGQDQGLRALTFDELLSDKTYQAEFDRRVQKALDTAKTKWQGEADTSIKGDRAVLGKNQSGYNNINSPVNTKYLTVVQKGKAETVVESTQTDDSALKVGDKVKMSSEAVQYGKKAKFASFVYKATLYVREMNGNRIVVSTQKTGAVTGAVHQKYLKKI